MNDSVRRIFIAGAEPVTIESVAFPVLERLQLRLDNAVLRPNPPRPPSLSSERAPALQVRELRVAGSRVSLGPAIAGLRLQAREVRLEQARDDKDEITLTVRSAEAGEVEITADKSDLEKAVAAAAGHEAGKQGVTIEDVKLDVRERGPRSASVEIQIKARKLFFTTVIRITADLDLDEQLNATISGLRCKGDGAIGALACGFLTPHLEKIDGRSFALLALPLGEVKLRDVRLAAAADTITVQADFGA